MRYALILLALSPAITALPAQQGEAIAVTAQRVLDGTGQQLSNAAVIVEGSRITSVGPVPAGFRGRRIDLGNATIMPGLIDVHSHVVWYFNAQGRYHTSNDGETPAQGAIAAAGNAYETLMSGITTLQSPGSPEDKDLRDAINRKALPGPMILTSLGSLSGGEPDSIRQRIRQFKARGADLIKIFASRSIREGGGPTMTAEQLAAACGEAHAQGLRAMVHAHAAEAMMLCLRALVWCPIRIDVVDRRPAESARVAQDVRERHLLRGREMACLPIGLCADHVDTHHRVRRFELLIAEPVHGGA